MSALTDAASHVEIAGDHHRAARASHADLSANLGRIADLATRAHAAAKAGQPGKAAQILSDLQNETTLGRENHAATAGHHRALGRSLEAAQKSIDAAATEAPGAENSTAKMGAQTSAGQSPRSFTAEEIRLRDQRAGINASYQRRIGERR